MLILMPILKAGSGSLCDREPWLIATSEEGLIVTAFLRSLWTRIAFKRIAWLRCLKTLKMWRLKAEWIVVRLTKTWSFLLKLCGCILTIHPTLERLCRCQQSMSNEGGDIVVVLALDERRHSRVLGRVLVFNKKIMLWNLLFFTHWKL